MSSYTKPPWGVVATLIILQLGCTVSDDKIRDRDYGGSWSVFGTNNFFVVLKNAYESKPYFEMAYERVFEKGEIDVELAKKEAIKTLISRVRYPYVDTAHVDDKWTDEELISKMKFKSIKKNTKSNSVDKLTFRVVLPVY